MGCVVKDFKQVVASGYDQIAQRYAAWSPTTLRGPKTKYLKVALRLVPAGGDALDLGCGTGEHLTRHLARHYHVTGVDLSSAAIAAARGRLDQAQLSDRADLSVGECQKV